MGLLDFFKKGPSQSAVLAQVRKAKERYAQSDYRRMAMEKLLKWDTDESLKGVLERFTVVVQSPHWDEEEKRWLKEELSKLGDRIEPLLRSFILEKNDINHVLEAYKAIVGKEKYQQLLMQSLKHRPPSDHRSVQGKAEIIAALKEESDLDIGDVLLPYLDDHSDDVQCVVVDALARSMDEKITKKFIEVLGSEYHSARVIRAIANVLAKNEVLLRDNIKLSDVVKEDYIIKKGVLTRIKG